MLSVENIHNPHGTVSCSFKNSNLPLVDYLIAQVSDCSLEDVCIVGGQHLLGTTFSMFQALSKLGLKNDRIFLIGKCYSSNSSVISEMLSHNFNISSGSTFFKPDESFDDIYSIEVRKFYEEIVEKVNKLKPKKIILIDDGGVFLSIVQPSDFLCKNIIGIEQTTSGYRHLKKNSLSFPVINVARSFTKLKYESPIISQCVVEKMLSILPSIPFEYNQALVIGSGAIGLAVKEELKHIASVDVFDKSYEKSDFLFLEERISKYDLIIGCTGETSIPYTLHPYLKRKCILISASSSDREFDAYFLRRKTHKYVNCHKNLKIGERLLINSGFPINFDGNKHSVQPKYIQLTRALLVAAIIQAQTLHDQTTNGFVGLSEEFQNIIVDRFLHEILSNSEVQRFYGKHGNKVLQYL